MTDLSNMWLSEPLSGWFAASWWSSKLLILQATQSLLQVSCLGPHKAAPAGQLLLTLITCCAVQDCCLATSAGPLLARAASTHINSCK